MRTKGRIAVIGSRGIPSVPGGVESHCEQLYPRLVERGWGITVFGREPYTQGRYTTEGVEVVSLRASGGKGSEAFSHTLRAINSINREDFDLVHVHSIGPAALLPLLKLRFSGPVVFTYHAPDYRQKKWGLPGKAFLLSGEAAGMLLSDAVICVSKSQSRTLERRYHRTIDVIPNGPAYYLKHEGQALLDEIGVRPKSYVLFVGRLIPDKRVEDAIHAVDKSSATRLVIVGESSHSDEYVSRLRDIKSEKIIFAGRRVGAELEELYSNADVFVLPSSVEGLPLSLLEAMAYSIPCIASNIPANREVLDDGRCGLLRDVGDIDGVAQAIDYLNSDPDLRNELAECGARRIASTYDWDLIAEMTSSVYERLVP